MLAQLASHAVTAHGALLAATTTKKSSGSSTIILFLVVILGAGYFLYMRPRSRARLAQQQATQQRPLDVGDEVATTAGIVGTVRRVLDDRVELEISPGMRIQVLRQNVGRPLSGPSASDLAPGGLSTDDASEDAGTETDWSGSSSLAPGGLLEEDEAGETVGDDDSDSSLPPVGARSGRRRSGLNGGWSRTSSDAKDSSGG